MYSQPETPLYMTIVEFTVKHQAFRESIPKIRSDIESLRSTLRQDSTAQQFQRMCDMLAKYGICLKGLNHDNDSWAVLAKMWSDYIVECASLGSEVDEQDFGQMLLFMVNYYEIQVLLERGNVDE
jgi:hypothetical protein